MVTSLHLMSQKQYSLSALWPLWYFHDSCLTLSKSVCVLERQGVKISRRWNVPRILHCLFSSYWLNHSQHQRGKNYSLWTYNIFNPLNTKRRTLYLKTQFVPRRPLHLKTQFVPRRLLYLKTQFLRRRLLFLKTQFLTRSKHFSSRL